MCGAPPPHPESACARAPAHAHPSPHPHAASWLGLQHGLAGLQHGRRQGKVIGVGHLEIDPAAGTSKGEKPSASTAAASSVTARPLAASACCNRPRRNICGVWASHLSCRSSVVATRPAAPLLSVSASGWASRPPTGSFQQASIRARTWAGVIRQRAASCTSTQSSATAPRVLSTPSPFNTLSAREAPPLSAAWQPSARPACSRVLSPGATTTSTPARPGVAAKAARVWPTRGCPARGWYCLGPTEPAREPEPAQGISTQQRGEAGDEAVDEAGDDAGDGSGDEARADGGF